jgi:cytochrome c
MLTQTAIRNVSQRQPATQPPRAPLPGAAMQTGTIELMGDSPLTIAPPFRTLHLKFPIESLRRRLAEGIVADHPAMPQFRLDPDQLADVMAYLQTFEP